MLGDWRPHGPLAAPGKVRPIETNVLVEPAPDRLVHWQDQAGRFHRGVMKYFGKTREADGTDWFWLWVEGDVTGWVREDLMVSRQTYEAWQ